jgi:hypothetical protein
MPIERVPKAIGTRKATFFSPVLKMGAIVPILGTRAACIALPRGAGAHLKGDRYKGDATPKATAAGLKPLALHTLDRRYMGYCWNPRCGFTLGVIRRAARRSALSNAGNGVT